MIHELFSGKTLARHFPSSQKSCSKATLCFCLLSTMAGSTTTPLPPSHQKFLQRLLSCHALTEQDANEIWQQYNNNNNDNAKIPFGAMNAQLTAGFGLEICSIKLQGTKYHTLINQHADKMSELAFDHEFTPHQRAYIRAVLERLVVAHTANDEEEQEEGVSRMDLINLRTTISKPFTMPSIQDATDTLDRLLDEHWLMLSINSSKKRQSMAQLYDLGPRTYLELSSLLVDLGYPKEDLPQFLLYRS